MCISYVFIFIHSLYTFFIYITKIYIRTYIYYVFLFLTKKTCINNINLYIYNKKINKKMVRRAMQIDALLAPWEIGFPVPGVNSLYLLAYIVNSLKRCDNQVLDDEFECDQHVYIKYVDPIHKHLYKYVTIMDYKACLQNHMSVHPTTPLLSVRPTSSLISSSRSSSSSLALHTLPNDVWSCIAPHLTILDWHHLKETSREMNAKFTNNQFVNDVEFEFGFELYDEIEERECYSDVHMYLFSIPPNIELIYSWRKDIRELMIKQEISHNKLLQCEYYLKNEDIRFKCMKWIAKTNYKQHEKTLCVLKIYQKGLWDGNFMITCVNLHMIHQRTKANT